MQFNELWTENAVIEELGQRIARYRLNQNLTQQKLADKAGTGLNTIYRLEQGHSIQLSNLIRITRALGLLNNFDSLAPEPPPSPIEQAKLKKKERKRASLRKGEDVPLTTWEWGDKA
jgi:putative transcriptional regulator